MTDNATPEDQPTPEAVAQWEAAVDVIRGEHPDWTDEQIAAGLAWAVNDDARQHADWTKSADEIQAEHPDWTPEMVAAGLAWAVNDAAAKRPGDN